MNLLAWMALASPDGARLCFAALVCLSTAAAPAPLPPNDLVARGNNGVVVTGEPHATAVGLRVLREGGNAIDAAVA
ncbi:MAG: gamma-glutamyltransferase, partial [Planctomycetota bacterium]